MTDKTEKSAKKNEFNVWLSDRHMAMWLYMINEIVMIAPEPLF